MFFVCENLSDSVCWNIYIIIIEKCRCTLNIYMMQLLKSFDVSLNISVSCNMWECRRHICGIRGFEAKWRWLWTLSLQFAFMSPNQPPFSRSKNLAFRNLLTLTDFRKSSRQGKGDVVGIVLVRYYAPSILDFWSVYGYIHACSAFRSKYTISQNSF